MAQSASYELQLFRAELEVKQACTRLDEANARLEEAAKAARDAKTKVRSIQNANSGDFDRESSDLIQEELITLDESLGILYEQIDSHPNPRVQEFIEQTKRNNALRSHVHATEYLPLEEAYSEAFSEKDEAYLAKARAEDALKELRENPPSSGEVVQNEDAEGLSPDADETPLDAEDLGAAGTGKSTIETGTIGRTDSYIDRVSVLFGVVGESDLTFQNFGQRINTDDEWTISLDVAFGGPIIRDNQIYYTLNYTHIEMDQDTHTNIVGGAVGQSSGSASFDYFGVGLAMEREVERFGMLGLGAGIGALVQDVSGSFRASGTTGAIKLDAYSRHRLSPRVTAGPFASVILPLDDVSGGAGAATSRFDADPIFLLGLRLDLMPF